ncbi:MAG TPA: hypothetical protein VFI39_07170 [Gemmatimonadales bacterium]|nr:hypothetical protein [Gemmatimonadales bacterium]
MPSLLRSRILIAAALLLGVSCGSGSTGPSGSGTLHLTLTTPHADDGAVMFTVHGTAIDSVTFPVAYSGYYRRSADRDTVTVIVAGHVGNGVIADLTVPAGSPASGYTALVKQAAQRSTFAQRTLSGYLVAVSQ